MKFSDKERSVLLNSRLSDENITSLEAMEYDTLLVLRTKDAIWWKSHFPKFADGRIDYIVESIKSHFVREAQTQITGEEQEKKMRKSVAGVCHCCVFSALGGVGSSFDLLRKRERRLKWLAILLRKRERPDDLAFASAIDSGAWP